MEIDLINLITILNLHLFWEEYSKITHNFSNYNNKHFKHFRSLHIYLSKCRRLFFFSPSKHLLRHFSPHKSSTIHRRCLFFFTRASSLFLFLPSFLHFSCFSFSTFFFLFLFPFQQDSSRFSSERARMRDAQGGSAIIESVSVAPGDFRRRGVK